MKQLKYLNKKSNEKNNPYMNYYMKYSNFIYTHLKSQTLPLIVLASILVSVLVLIFTIGLVGSTGEQLVTASQDAACRVYLEASASFVARSGTSVEQLARAEQSFFGQLSRYCRTEFLLFEHRDEEYVFGRMSDAAIRCNRRYGSGELQFLDYFQREGSYCFICAEIEFEDADSSSRESFRYRDLGLFMENEIPKERNDERKTALELSNLFYVNVRGGDNTILETDLFIQSRSSYYTEDLVPYFSSVVENYDYFRNIYNREFRVQDKTYIVYRYDLVQDIDNVLATQQLQGVLTSAAYSFGKKRLGCMGKGLAASTVSGPAAPIIGAISTVGCVAGAIGGAFSLYSSISQINLLEEDIPRIMSIFEFPNANHEFSQEDEQVLILVNNWISNPSSFSPSDLDRISPFILNNLDSTNRRIYQRIQQGEEINENTLNEFITEVSLRQISVIMRNIESFNFEQYVEIMSQGDFYRECGIVSNTNLRR